MSVTAGKMLARDWRGGELGVLLLALILAVGVVSGISAFATRLQNALTQESHRFLAADLVVRSSREMPQDWLQRAADEGIAQALTLVFPSMVYAGDEGMHLVSVKAVSDEYPLRGSLTFSEQPFGSVLPATGGPPPWTGVAGIAVVCPAGYQRWRQGGRWRCRIYCRCCCPYRARPGRYLFRLWAQAVNAL